jgi:DNA-binding response OmpR family regulator
MAERRQTALGVARARFVDGLARKTREVRASLALLAGTPDEERPREELRRRLHALYASAQVFRIEPLAAALKEAIANIDAVRDQRRGFSQDEIDVLATLASTLPGLGKAGGDLGAAANELITEPETLAPPPPSSVPPKPESVFPSKAPKPTKPKKHSAVETVISVLVVDEPEQHARVRAALPPDRFEVLAAADPEEALRLARSGAPDLVLADRAIVLKPGVDLIGRLREDPLTDFVPVVLLLPPGAPLDPIAVREAGADEAMVKPLDAQTVLRTVERVTRMLGGPAGASTLTGDLTLEEIAERIGDEVKRGIVEAAEKGRDVAVPVGDGTTLLAAAWSTIGRVRAHLAERSGGRVRFREAAARGGPAFVTVVGDEKEDASAETVAISGRRIVVCDDDPAVVWFFAGLLREHGADVVETNNGMEAIEAALKKRPDLVVSDILMPKLDGFGLTRAFKRDPMLADVPVILLSWKEDLLQRMRELRAGASGYLRKEAAAPQILGAVRDALRPRARLESRLHAGGDVRGRLEDVGIQTLLTTIASLRPTARITLRSASSLYEIDLAAGEIIDVTRTASDGTFSRGPRVLEGLLGTISGRYTVADGDGSGRRSVDVPLASLLESGMRAIAARIDAVSGKNLAKAAEVTLDEELLGYLLRSSPEEVERVVEHIRAGRGPRRLLLDGEVAPQVLEEVLVDLARQGAIRRVTGPDGEDRIALAREARDRGHHPELSEHDEHGTLSWLPPQQRPKEGVAAPVVSAPELLRSTFDEELESLKPPPLPSEARRPLEELEPPETAEPPNIRALDEPFLEPAPTSAPPPERRSAAPPPLPPRKSTAPPSLPPKKRDPDDSGDWPLVEAHEGGDNEAWDVEDTLPPTPPATPPGALAAKLVESVSEEKPVKSERPARSSSAPQASSPQPRTSIAAPPPERKMGFVAWTLVLLMLAVAGFVVWRVFFLGDEHAERARERGPVTPHARPAPPEPEPEIAREPVREPEVLPEPEVVEPEPGADLPLAYGREEEGAAVPGAVVGEGQGLLVLEPLPGGTPATVTINAREWRLADGLVPIALDEGVHHLTYQRGDHRDFIWVAVRAGHTRFVPPLP